MDTFWTAAGGWWVQAALSGGAVLLLGWLGMLAFRRPALRQQIGAWAVRGAVLAAVLSALPHWMLLPRPAWMTSPGAVEVAQAPIPTPESTRQPAPPALVGESEPEAVEWVFVPREAVARPEQPLVAEPMMEPPAENVAVRTPNDPESVRGVNGSSDSPVSPVAAVVPLLVSVHLVIAGVLLLQLMCERLGLAWLLRDATPLVGRARWVLDQLTVGEPLPVALSSARVRSPLCVGFFRPLLVLPKGMADGADEPTLRWVLAHEWDHLRRGDTRTVCWVGVARAAFFFMPWFWLVRRDLGLCQEFLADAAAANVGGTSADYAAFLVELSGGRTTRRPLPAARMRAGKSELFRRVHMLLNVKTAARGVTRGFTWLAGTAAVATGVSLAGLGFADEPKKEEPKPAKVIEIEKAKDAPKEVPAEVTQKQLHELIEALQGKGKLDEAALAELIKKLEKDGVIDPGTLQRMVKRKDVVEVIDWNRLDLPAERLRLQLPADVIRGGRVVQPPAESDLRKQYEQQLKEFEERIKKAGDAEAKEQLELTRDEYKKAMEEPLKKADAAQKDVDAARRKLDDAERANRDQNAEAFRRLAEMQRDMQKRMAEDFRRLEGREGFGRLDVQPFVIGPDGLFAPVSRNAAQPRLGVKIEKVSAVLAEQLDLPKDSGIVISDVTAGSAAEKAGLKKNDVLLKLAGKDVPTDPEAFTALVGKLNAGEKLDAEVLRKGKKETVKGIELPEVKRPVRGDSGVGRPGGGERGGVVVGGNEQVQLQINGDEASLQATVGDAAYTVTGTVEKGKLTPTKIVVKEGRESKEYASLDKMPEDQKATVERLLGKVRLVAR